MRRWRSRASQPWIFSLSSSRVFTSGMGVSQVRRNWPTSPSTPPFSWAPSMPGWQKRVESVVGAEQHPARVLAASPPGAVQDLGDGGGGCRSGCARSGSRREPEGFDVALEERFLPACGIDAVDRGTGVESRYTNRWHLVFTPSRRTHTSPKSTSASAPAAWSCGIIATAATFAVLDRDPRSASAHVVPHRRVRHQGVVLVQEAGVDPARGVPLLPRRIQVGHEHRVDRLDVRAELRCHPLRVFRGGGSADASACRTVRRCT